jgi:DtxR family transcriptional regulator, Mn-dependent transcriptional regulator
MASGSEENYLEAIYDISRSRGYARVKDIAVKLRVRPPSVTGMISRLRDKGLVECERYGHVRLSGKGRRIGAATRSKHDVFKRFLLMLSVPESIAEKDACSLEHNLHEKTVLRIRDFVSFLESGGLGDFGKKRP